MITLYDIPSKLEGNFWSPNTIKTRIALNHKGLEYQTKWVEYPDIEPTLKALGGKPTDKKPDGRDHYTLPAIHDSLTNAIIIDSFAIAEYLDNTYPEAPPIFPKGSKAAILFFQEKFTTYKTNVFPPLAGTTVKILNPPSEAYFRQTREAMFGKKLEDLVPVDGAQNKRWVDFREGLEKIAGVYEKNGQGNLYYLGETFSYADATTISFLVWIKLIYGEESDEWKAIEGVAGGHWKRHLESADKWIHSGGN